MFSTRWCCDRHGDKIDFTLFGPQDPQEGEPLTRQWEFIYVTFGAEGGDQERKGANRKELVKVLAAWRQKTYHADPINFLYDVQDILTEDGISLVTKIPPSQLHRDGPGVITKELGETLKWGSRHAMEVFKQVWEYDYNNSEPVPTYQQ